MEGDIYAVIDTETSGLPDYKLPAEHPSQPYVAEFGMWLLDSNLEIETKYHAYIKPEGWVMEDGASKINGLKTDFLMEKGIPIAEVLDVYEDTIKGGRIIVAHNAQFDCKMMRGAFRRLNRPDLFEQTPNLCTMRALTDVCKIPPAGNRGGYKFPKLSEACVFFGLTEYGDHSVGNDINAVVLLMREMRKRGIPFPEAKVHFAKPDHPALPKNVAAARQQQEPPAVQSLADLGLSDAVLDSFKGVPPLDGSEST